MTDQPKKAKEKLAPLTETDLDDRLRVKYPAPEYAYFSGVRNATGFVRSARTIDGLAIGLWPSRGVELIGFEIKCSRSDWMREKKDPAKAHAIAKYCDRWFLVVNDPAVIQPGELPAAWGLIVPYHKGLKIETAAPLMASQPWDRLFLASLIRNIEESYIHRSSFRGEIEAARKDAMSTRDYEFNRMAELIANFEKASGVSLKEGWDAGDIGEAVKLVRDHGIDFHRRSLKSLRDQAKRIMESADYALSKEGFNDRREEPEDGSKEVPDVKN